MTKTTDDAHHHPTLGAGFADVPPEERSSAVAELGMETRQEGDLLVGEAELTPEMWQPGTDVVRTSVLTVWADSVTGLLAGLSIQPTICVTLDLDLHLRRPLTGLGRVRLEASTIKIGRQVTINRVDLTHDDESTPFATGTASFMASPNPAHVMPEGGFLHARPPKAPRLGRPIADRTSIRRLGPGRAEIPWMLGNLNATGSIQGGLLALVAEEAVLAADPDVMLSALSIRYLRPFPQADALATADLGDGLALVDITNTTTGKLGAVVTAHLRRVG